MAGRVLRDSRGHFAGSTKGFGAGAKKPRNGQYAGLGGGRVKRSPVAAARAQARTTRARVATNPNYRKVADKQVGVQVAKRTQIRGKGANRKKITTYTQRKVTLGDVGNRHLSGAKSVATFRAQHLAHRSVIAVVTGQKFKAPGAGYNAAVYAAGYKGKANQQMNTAIRKRQVNTISAQQYKSIRRKQLARNAAVGFAVAGGVAYAKRNTKIESVFLNAAYTAAVKRKQAGGLAKAAKVTANATRISSKAAKINKGFARRSVVTGAYKISSL